MQKGMPRMLGRPAEITLSLSICMFTWARLACLGMEFHALCDFDKSGRDGWWRSNFVNFLDAAD